MKQKPLIVEIVDFPVSYIAPSILRLRGDSSWLSACYQVLKTRQAYDGHEPVFARDTALPRCVETGGQLFYLYFFGLFFIAGCMKFILDRIRAGMSLRRLNPDLVHAWGTAVRHAICGHGAPVGVPIRFRQGGALFQQICPMRGCMARFL